MKGGGLGTTLEGMRETCKTLIPNSKGKPPLDRKRHVLEGSIQSKVTETGYDYLNYIQPAEGMIQLWGSCESKE
jgi:hypothetical protein